MTTVDDNRIESLALRRKQFRDELVQAGLLVPMGIDGLYGRGAVFEAVIDGIDHVVRRKGRSVHGDQPKLLRFPPVYSRAAFEKTDYIASFPDLTGAISTFTGGTTRITARCWRTGTRVSRGTVTCIRQARCWYRPRATRHTRRSIRHCRTPGNCSTSTVLFPARAGDRSGADAGL